MQAICFDFDGTLVDSEVFHAQNWSDYLADHEVDMSSEVFLRDYAGVTWIKVAQDLKSRFFLKPDIEEILEQMVAITHDALMKGTIPAKVGVDEMLREFHGNLPLAVVTGAPRDYVEGILQRHGWLELFDHVFCGEDVENNKPEPDIYELACKTLGYCSSRVIAIEDSLTGLQSASSAGLKVVLVNDIQNDWRITPDYHFSTIQDARPVVAGLLNPEQN
ncbi:HAD family hydrolase [Photobacterium sp. J15]|uniref:HAD family hydrolase n=1 Tax=Photobacterium sp. J15 TaxID=265901 RepID=UPI0007E376F0|nr:HAD family phosphatase [Photobacterium sp. J15]